MNNRLRKNEVSVDLPKASHAELYFIGMISTPWKTRADTPRQGDKIGDLCTIEVFNPWIDAIKGIEKFSELEVLYWLHEAQRDIVLQSPADNGDTYGTFALRSPVRPNPIGTAIVKLERVDGPFLFVRGLDCIDGTPLIDLKPERGLIRPIAPPKGIHPMDVE